MGKKIIIKKKQVEPKAEKQMPIFKERGTIQMGDVTLKEVGMLEGKRAYVAISDEIVKDDTERYIRHGNKILTRNEYRTLINDKKVARPKIVSDAFCDWKYSKVASKYDFYYTTALGELDEEGNTIISYESESANVMITYLKKSYDNDNVDYDDKFTVLSPMLRYHKVKFILERFDEEGVITEVLGEFTESELLEYLAFLESKNAMWLDEDDVEPNPKDAVKVVVKKVVAKKTESQLVTAVRQAEVKSTPKIIIKKKVDAQAHDVTKIETLKDLVKKFGFEKEDGDYVKDYWSIALDENVFDLYQYSDAEEEWVFIKTYKTIELLHKRLVQIDDASRWEESK